MSSASFYPSCRARTMYRFFCVFRYIEHCIAVCDSKRYHLFLLSDSPMWNDSQTPSWNVSSYTYPVLSSVYCVLCSTTSVSHDGNLATRVSPFISAPTMTNIAQYFHPFGMNKRNSVPGSNVPNGCTPKRRRMKCFRLPSEISNVSAFDPNSGWLVPSLSSDVKRFTLH